MISERVTVLFKSEESLNECVLQEESSLKLTECIEPYLIQRRFELSLKDITDTSPMRFTWKNNTNSLYVIGPRLNNGANLYIGGDKQPLDSIDKQDSIITPTYRLYHQGEDVKILFNSFIERLGLDINLDDLIDWDWTNKQYDIVHVNSTLQINEYTIVPPNSAVPAISKDSSTTGLTIDKLEVGLFYVDLIEEENINLSGLRCLWEEEGTGSKTSKIEKCIKTSLLYKSAFAPVKTSVSNSINVSLEEPIGLHPKLLVDLSNVSHQSKYERCEYYLFSQLPLELFVDKFQSEPVFVFGEHNLESPDYKLADNSWGSETLFSLNRDEINEITLHSRYISPEEGKPGLRKVSFTPEIIMACDTGSDSIDTNPFYSKGLGYESYFTRDTVFYPLKSEHLEVPIPYPSFANYKYVELFTSSVMVASIIYLLYKLFGPVTSHTKSKPVDDKKKTN
ncbi:similar to Saccharomyces cerevisiae YCL052C PBN1 Essential component of glycosylphosphatidylinositol-mannosyltransferase I [Maudiozyma saulgeensis]|uniref:Protein PBN1 n=1 Tax=Maudiozyma saulgeensis TaxID=1789683 RepID=A0A1X7R368_9SACH|nr:similar to Saccharomyces cerevisiae YCL052C PBN1 Essential component of glycosylphosphatidylinositol-mannosyltransferase I [Kazachstania saulgeensis]